MIRKRNGSRIESDENFIVEEDVVRLKDGFDRFYRVSPDCMSLRDRTSNQLPQLRLRRYSLSNCEEASGLQDWDSIVNIELTRSSRPVHLQVGQEWRAAQQLANPSK